MPILLGTLAVLVLGALAVAAWLVLNSAGTSTPPADAPTTSAAAPSRSSRAPEPTSAAPTSEAPSAGTAEGVPVPPLVGLRQADAEALLDRLGVAYEVRREPSDQPAGTVVDTDPAQGERVLPGDTVVLVVAGERETSEPTTAAPSSAGPSSAAPTATG
jgi:hypothetical protein